MSIGVLFKIFGDHALRDLNSSKSSSNGLEEFSVVFWFKDILNLVLAGDVKSSVTKIDDSSFDFANTSPFVRPNLEEMAEELTKWIEIFEENEWLG